MTDADAISRDLVEVRIGASACLMGENVRYDGRHRRSEFVADLLATQVECVSVCPEVEVEVGMGMPRPTVERVRSGSAIGMIESERRVDHTRPYVFPDPHELGLG